MQYALAATVYGACYVTLKLGTVNLPLKQAEFPNTRLWMRTLGLANGELD